MIKTPTILCTALVALSCGGTSPGSGPSGDGEPSPATMTIQARGTFDVELAPRTVEGPTFREGVSAMSLSKAIRGDLEGTSIGEMLAFRSDVEGSAGYVALEKVTGTLHGRSGSFILQHSSTMDRNAPTQSIVVIPDSGTDALEGISGEFRISIVDGRHFYEFDYSLPGT